jgi:hypothetical protein
MELRKIQQEVAKLNHQEKVAFAISLLDNIESEISSDYSNYWLNEAKYRLSNSQEFEYEDALKFIHDLK